MKKLIQTTTLLLTIITLFSYCKKEDPEPDPIPYFDKFRCKINGQLYTPYCEGNLIFGCNPIDCQYYHDTKKISLRVRNERINLSMAVRSSRGVKIGNNSLSKTIGGGVTDDSYPNGCQSFDHDTTRYNNITILSIDTVNFKIEGEFEFDALNQCGDTLRVREGYFNTNYRF